MVRLSRLDFKNGKTLGCTPFKIKRRRGLRGLFSRPFLIRSIALRRESIIIVSRLVHILFSWYSGRKFFFVRLLSGFFLFFSTSSNQVGFSTDTLVT